MTFIKKKTNHKINFLDLTFHRTDWKKYIEFKLNMFKPEILCVSALTYNYFDSLIVTRYLKVKYPNLIVIYGGIHPSTCPEETIRNKLIDIIDRKSVV